MSFSRSFQAAFTAFQNKEYDLAQSICEQLTKQIKNCEIFHLLALINKAKNKLDKSRYYFEIAVKYGSNNANIHANFANLLANLNDNQLAKKHYSIALKLDPEFSDVKVNFSLLLSKERNLSAALNLIDSEIEKRAQPQKLLKIKAKILQNCLEFNQSEALFRVCLAHDPSDYFCQINYVCVLRELEQYPLALSFLQQITIQQPQNSEIAFLTGCIYYDQQAYKEAEYFLKQALIFSPENIAAHEALNKLYWEQDQQALFLTSYEILKNTVPSAQLSYSKIAQQIQANQFEQAQVELNLLPNSIINTSGFTHLQAVIADRLGDKAKANDFYARAALADPGNLRLQIDFANLLIKQKKYLQALSILEPLSNLHFFNQELWAYKGICWRLLNNPKHNWLNNYEQFIQPINLGYPSGYDSQAHFLHELSDTLISLHTGKNQPLDQSVRQGTQTIGNLLNKKLTVIQEYKHLLTKAAHVYLNQLPTDPTHPLLSRNRGQFSFEGSWSVKLNSGGFHSNHVHPLGWISGPSYINVPKEINANDPTKAGWVKFGETALELGEDEHIGRMICPQSGFVVLFPSYMWHGTQPFNSLQTRLTAPVDISPQ